MKYLRTIDRGYASATYEYQLEGDELGMTNSEIEDKFGGRWGCDAQRFGGDKVQIKEYLD